MRWRSWREEHGEWEGKRDVGRREERREEGRREEGRRKGGRVGGKEGEWEEERKGGTFKV